MPARQVWTVTHALTSQRLGLLQLHDNLLRRVLRELPHGHPFCPATSSQDYSEQPSQNKRSEKPRPLHLGKADLDVIADQLNDRPRKTLNWDTPKQRLELLLRA